MTSQLTVTKALGNAGWTITATIAPGGTIPQAIFVYENTGIGNLLGPYFGITSPADLARLPMYDGSTAFPIFSNKFLRYTTGTLIVPITQDTTKNVDAEVANLVQAIKDFSTAYQAQNTSTSIYNIT